MIDDDRGCNRISFFFLEYKRSLRKKSFQFAVFGKSRMFKTQWSFNSERSIFTVWYNDLINYFTTCFTTMHTFLNSSDICKIHVHSSHKNYRDTIVTVGSSESLQNNYNQLLSKVKSAIPKCYVEDLHKILDFGYSVLI